MLRSLAAAASSCRSGLATAFCCGTSIIPLVTSSLSGERAVVIGTK
jgi:hypothetical protein